MRKGRLIEPPFLLDSACRLRSVDLVGLYPRITKG